MAAEKVGTIGTKEILVLLPVNVGKPALIKAVAKGFKSVDCSGTGLGGEDAALDTVVKDCNGSIDD